MFYGCTIEIPGPAWLSHFTRRANTLQEAELIFNKFCQNINIPGAKVTEVWETTEADWLDMILHDKEVL